MTPLTDEQIGFAIKAMSRYISILEEQRKPSPTRADVDHSALLNRLLSGKEPLPEPPPLFYGYPAYLLEEGEPNVAKVHCDKTTGRIIINQGGGWQAETKLGDDNTGVVIYKRTGNKYLLYQGSYQAWTLQENKTRAMQQHPSLMIRKMK